MSLTERLDKSSDINLGAAKASCLITPFYAHVKMRNMKLLLLSLIMQFIKENLALAYKVTRFVSSSLSLLQKKMQ